MDVARFWPGLHKVIAGFLVLALANGTGLAFVALTRIDENNDLVVYLALWAIALAAGLVVALWGLAELRGAFRRGGN
jgi:hypothetical protein